MNNIEAYNQWADTYDSNFNKTRDIEAATLREVLSALSFDHVLEIGCGTGKNTEWLAQKAKTVVAADFSEEMLNKARTKIKSPDVRFIQTDVRQPWKFKVNHFDLITFSLVLEHIQDIDSIFEKATRTLKSGGYLYLGELHPFKQYRGSKARFDTGEGVHHLDCYLHNVSDYIKTGKKHGFNFITLEEWFDKNNEKKKTSVPRLLTIVFKR